MIKEQERVFRNNSIDQDCWGISSSIDCYDCDADMIRSIAQVKLFTKQLIELIDMRAYGPCHVVYFGEDEKVAGLSMFQLIETSCISAHFANQSNAAYIDIFSCKKFDPEIAAKFCKAFFQAKSINIQTNFRR